MYYVYILYLETSRKLYTGFSSNLRQRIKQHLNNQVESTKKKGARLIHYEGYLLESDARRREKFLKTTEGKRLLRQQIRDILKRNKYSEIV